MRFIGSKNKKKTELWVREVNCWTSPPPPYKEQYNKIVFFFFNSSNVYSRKVHKHLDSEIIFPLYTIKVDFKSNSQDVIEVEACSFNSNGFNKSIALTVRELEPFLYILYPNISCLENLLGCFCSIIWVINWSWTAVRSASSICLNQDREYLGGSINITESISGPLLNF